MKKQFVNKKVEAEVGQFWDSEILPILKEYIKIPNKSPSFDKNWKRNGHMDKVLNLAKSWTEKHLPKNAKIITRESKGRTPILLVDVPGKKNGNVLMYGHLDKQPEMEGWDKDKGPWIPKVIDKKLYGRGGADDGYALFASLCALKALQNNDSPIPRVLVFIEFCEESGSPDLPHYMNICSKIIGSPDLVICLDSGTEDYMRLWTTNSLRGLISGTLKVNVLKEGMHSGISGAVPSSFRIIRQLLSRIENEDTGEVLIDELKVNIPDYILKETKNLISVVENPLSFPVSFSTDDPIEAHLRTTWKPALSIVGADGLPEAKNAGNVLRPYTSLKLSIRIPPLVDQYRAQSAVKKVLEENPPYGAKVSIDFEEPASGWSAPPMDPWLEKAVKKASLSFYKNLPCSMGEGGTIPFMAMLGDRFPNAQFIITGVLGPGSNAHGPNEFIHIPYAKKLTCCIASILNDFPE
jgi:acetylornithine deacetylase/succinyl-diaminopimelate desuccinylase-like protein